MGKRIRAELNVDDHWRAALAAFLEPRRAIAGGRPEAAAFPAGVRIVDAAVEPLGVETHWIGNADHDHPPILERNEAVAEICGGDGNIVAEPEGIMLIDPGVVACLRAIVADPFEAWTGLLEE